jgi:hypothetical protein
MMPENPSDEGSRQGTCPGAGVKYPKPAFVRQPGFCRDTFRNETRGEELAEVTLRDRAKAGGCL